MKLWLSALLLTFAGLSHAQNVSVAVNGTGLSALTWNGTSFLGDGRFKLNGVLLQSGTNPAIAGDLTATTQMNSSNQTLTSTYSWGTVSVVYTTSGNKLTLTITTTNTSASTITGLFFEPLDLQFPAAVAEFDGVDPMLQSNITGPSLLSMSYGSGVIVLANEDVVQPLSIGFPWALNKPANSLFPLRVNTNHDSMYPTFYPFINRPIAPGGSDQYQISLRFGPPGSTTATLGGDINARFENTFPQQLAWPDHRAAGALFLSTAAAGWPKNPRGWFQDPTVDVTTPAGVAAFQQRVLAYAANSVSILKSMNAQGMITWDIEGQQFPADTSYACDPTQLALLAPEMQPVADAYFKTFTDAGLKVGVCVRPQILQVAPDLSSASQVDAADPASVLIAKIQYANTRWGATLFYIDSNGGPNDPMDPGIFAQVAQAMPNVVLIPEHSNLKYYAWTAPYVDLQQTNQGTPASVKAIYPNAFSFIYTADGAISQDFATLTANVTKGDVLMYRSWFDDEPGNSLVRQIYQTAGVYTAPPSVAVSSPLNGSTVSGTIQLSAIPTGGTGALSVQFQVDGNNLNSPVTGVPYATSWNTSLTTNGTHVVRALVTDSAGNNITSPPVAITVNNTASTGSPATVRINSGGPTYVDSSGNTWVPDSGYTGGTNFTGSSVIANTSDSILYQTVRYGDFSYNLSVPNGTYNVTLKFAEVYFTSAGQRVFNVSINGQTVLSNMDIVAKAGAGQKALDQTFPVTVQNGSLTVQFTSIVNYAMVSAIQVSPGTTSGPPPNPPPPTLSTVRVHAGGSAYTDSLGNVWGADTGFSTSGTTGTAALILNTDNVALYQSERYGNMTFTAPVLNGTYNVTLKFAEMFWNKASARVFNVSVNGAQVLSNFDVFAAAGGSNRAVDRKFTIPVTTGSIVIQFTGVADYPTVSAIAIEPSTAHASAFSVGVTPLLSVIGPAASLQFTSSIAGTGANGVNWSVEGQGTVATNGLYTAPATAGQAQLISVKAAGSADPTTAGFGTLLLTPNQTIRVRSGGAAIADAAGNVWSADTGFSGGTAWASTAVPGGTTSPALYQDSRYGNFSYSFPVANGMHLVHLEFAEPYWNQAGKRVFNVFINGVEVLANLDLYQRAGFNNAVEQIFPVNVTNSGISIVFQPVTDNAIISALEID
jgi:hypothetical protein